MLQATFENYVKWKYISMKNVSDTFKLIEY